MRLRSAPKTAPASDRRFAACWCGALLLAAALGGCVTYLPSSAARERSSSEAGEYPPTWWPERRVVDLDHVVSGLPRVVHQTDPETGDRRTVARLANAVAVGEGLVQAIRPTDRDGHLIAPDEPPELRFVSIPGRAAPDASGAPVDPRLTDADAGFSFSLIEPEIGPVAALAVSVAATADARLTEVEEALLASGVAVARVDAPPLALRPLRLSIGGDDDLEPVARRVARHVDEALADRAYAIEGVVRYFDDRRPAVSPGPVVFVAADESTLALPAAALRLQGRVRAMVLVAPAANVLELALTSESLDLGVAIDGGVDRLPDASLRWLLDLYLASARLDPYRTAPYVASTPVVCVTGQWDEAVPNPVSALAWSRLERPDRFRVLGDHEDVLDEARDRAEWIAAWVSARL